MSDEVTLAVDGVEVAVPAGATLLDACRAAGADLPTLCRGDTLTPANACRVCVVELDGSRVLVPSCSRPAASGMVVRTGTERARHSRRLVLELLASSVELDRTPGIEDRLAEYGADPQRFGPDAATVAAAPIVDNELYVRDYARCILCYQCVDACGEQWQGTFAIAVAGRGFDARISTEWSVELPESACVYCGNCIAVCPTGALVPHREFELRAGAAWRPEDQTQTDTVCPYCGVGCTLTLHVQDDEIVKVTSPHDHDVTRGNLCVKGRFGWQYVHVGTTRRAPG
ncbi:MAG: 2Fe-2S iron-sulfur cluster-binding protein [Acidimicrobiales bacterium]